MTINKFWLVWNEAGNAPKKRHDTKESAYIEARRLASMFPQHVYVVLSAVCSFKANVSVTETDLNVDDEFNATEPNPTKPLTPKFKVGDVVMRGVCKYIIHEIALPNDNNYPCGFKGVAYKYKDFVTGDYGWIAESELSPWVDESPKNPFKVGDKVKYINTDVKLVTEYPTETGTIKEIRDGKDGDYRIYVLRHGSFYGFFNKEDLTLAE